MIDGDIRPWAGQRPATPSGRPIIGRTPIEHLYLSVGTAPSAGRWRRAAHALCATQWLAELLQSTSSLYATNSEPCTTNRTSCIASCAATIRLLLARKAAGSPIRQAKLSGCSGGAAVSCLGHGHPDVLAAMHAQIDRIAYAHTSFFSTEIAEQLADTLIDSAPGDISHAYLVSGGSEAMEAALKLARQYFVEKGEPQRARFIARRNSYHGNTLGAFAVGGNQWRRRQFAPLLIDVDHVAPTLCISRSARWRIGGAIRRAPGAGAGSDDRAHRR